MLFLPYKFFTMKKILGLFFVSLLFTGCDDGNVIIDETINLDNAEIVKCNLNNILFKIKENQAMILEISDINAAFKNKEETKALIPIDQTSNKLIFRTYNGEVKATNICATTFDIYPAPKEEWIAQSGVIEIKTIAIKSDPNTTTNATRITLYRHLIVLKNISWLKPDGKIQLENFDRPYGVYKTTPTNLPFGFQDSPLVFKSPCSDDNTIIAKSGSESMRLKLDDNSYAALFNNTITLPNAPKTKLITANNKLTYNLFNGLVVLTDFCTPLPATRPATLEDWKANISNGTTNGIIEVETSTETTTKVRHTIWLRGITFDNGNVNFYYGDCIKFGYFITDI
jgi:hypothetical protein